MPKFCQQRANHRLTSYQRGRVSQGEQWVCAGRGRGPPQLLLPARKDCSGGLPGVSCGPSPQHGLQLHPQQRERLPLACGRLSCLPCSAPGLPLPETQAARLRDLLGGQGLAP